jgi:hypothetical protein
VFRGGLRFSRAHLRAIYISICLAISITRSGGRFNRSTIFAELR